MRFFQYKLPFKKPFATAAGTFDLREGLLFLDEESAGKIGECAPLPPFTNHSLTDCLHWIKERTVTVDALLNAPFSSLRFAGAMLRSEHPKKNTPTKLNGLISLSESELVSKITKLSSDGFLTLKTKIGITPASEIEKINQISTLFPGMKMRLDANGSFSTEEALWFLKQINRANIDYIEQPVAKANVEGMIEIRQKSGVRIFADEAATDFCALEKLAKYQAVDGVVLKPHLIGNKEDVAMLVNFSRKQNWQITFTTLLESYYGRQFTASLAAEFASEETHGLATGDLLIRDFGTDRIENGQFLPIDYSSQKIDFSLLEEIVL